MVERRLPNLGAHMLKVWEAFRRRRNELIFPRVQQFFPIQITFRSLARETAVVGPPGDAINYSGQKNSLGATMKLNVSDFCWLETYFGVRFVPIAGMTTGRGRE